MLKRLLKVIFEKRTPPEAGAPRRAYAHPSHQNFARETVLVPRPPAVITAIPRKTSNHNAGTLLHFRDAEHLQALTLAHLKTLAGAETGVHAVNQAVAFAILKDKQLVTQVLGKTWVRDNLSKARKALKQQGRLTYNVRSQGWALNIDMAASSDGWRRISSPRAAIEWIHENFTPDEFESFTAAILAYCGVTNSRVTEKRAGSGADGGIDGFGDYIIDGQIENLAFQAKRLKPGTQLGEDHLRNFIGALCLNNIKHGVFIITADFSARSWEAAEKANGGTVCAIELIDEKRLIGIMLEKKDQPHGYGLDRRGDEFYLNEAILRTAAIRASARVH